jgi:hypothetical protein
MKNSEAMPAEPPDVHQTLEYRADAEFARWLPIGLLTCFCGLFLFALPMPDLPPLGETVGAAAAIATGAGMTVFALWRRFRRGRPVYVLSPEGIVIRIGFVKNILIPWRESQAVDTIEITVWHWLTRYPHHMTYRDVTVVLVSRAFYDARVHIGSMFLRGPYWHEVSFIQKGELTQCALHHELVSTEPQALRAAVEARWQAFRDQPAASARPRGPSVPTVIAAWRRAAAPTPAPRIVAAGGTPRPISWWETVKIALPLIGIVVVGTNLLGLWATDAQTKAYEKKKEWAEWRARNAAERKALDEKLRKQREELDDFWRRFR